MRLSRFVLFGVIAGLAFLFRPPPYTLFDVESLPKLDVRIAEIHADVLVRGLGVEDLLFTKEGEIFAGLMKGDFVQFVNESFCHYNVLSKRFQPAFIAGKSLGGRLWFTLAQYGVASFVPGPKRLHDIRLHSIDAVNFPNQLDVHVEDGRVFFSDSFARNVPEQTVMDTLIEVLFSGEKSGRRLAFDPSTNQTSVLLDGLAFANGVAISPDSSFVAVSETMRARIWRVWLTGPNKGKSEIWVENLPGYPDNLHSDGKHVYVSLGLLRNSFSEFIYSNRWARTVLPRLPSPPIGADPGGFVRIDWNSNSFSTLYNIPNLPGSTSIIPHKDHVYITSYFVDGYISRIEKKHLK